MNPFLPTLMKKMAAEGQKRWAPALTKGELRTLKQEIKEIKPKTEEERRISELIGRPPTKGQYMRSAAIGAGGGLTAHVLGRAIQGGGMSPWVGTKADLLSGKATLSPRQLARAVTMGVVFGAAVPAFKRLMDIEAAKRGKF